MAINWFKKLIESPEERKEREAKERLEQIEQLKESEEFRDVMVNAFQSLKDKEERDKENEKLKHIEKMNKARLDVELVGESMQDSPEPFANVLAMGFDKTRGIHVKIDFNPAFIRYLKTFGIVASNDEETIRVWLAHMADDIMREEMAQDYILNGVDENEKPAMGYDEMFQIGQEEDADENNNNRWK